MTRRASGTPMPRPPVHETIALVPFRCFHARVPCPIRGSAFWTIAISVVLPGLLVLGAGCGAPASDVISRAITDSPDQLVFAGKVVDASTGEWPNDRLVIVYLKGKEIGRGVTALREWRSLSDGPVDGVFAIRVSNPYRLTLQSFGPQLKQPDGSDKRSQASVHRTIGMTALTDSSIDIWFAEFPYGQAARIPVPSKNIEYAVKVIVGEVSTLPKEIRAPGTTELTKDGRLVVVRGSDDPIPLPTVAGPRDSSAAEVISIRDVVLAKDPTLKEISGRLGPPTSKTLDACKSSTPVTGTLAADLSKFYARRLELKGSLNIPLWRDTLLAQLSAMYSYEDREVLEIRESYNLEAPPGKRQLYTLSFFEEWRSGTATIVTTGGERPVEFSVLPRVSTKIAAQTLACD